MSEMKLIMENWRRVVGEQEKLALVEQEIENFLNENEDEWKTQSRRDFLKKALTGAAGAATLGSVGALMGREKKGSAGLGAAAAMGAERAKQISSFKDLAQAEGGGEFTTGPEEMNKFFAKHSNCIEKVDLATTVVINRQPVGKYFYAVNPRCIKNEEILPFVQMSKDEFQDLMYMTFIDFDKKGYPISKERLEKRVKGGKGASGWWNYGGPIEGFNEYNDGLMMPPEWSATLQTLDEVEYMMNNKVQEMIEKIRNILLS